MNVIKAIINLVKLTEFNVENATKLSNRANAMGEGLENFIQHLFAGIEKDDTREDIKEKIEKTFSYIGNANNPPDLMLVKGDAIEVKKIESYGSGLALNSSPPKNKLYNVDSRITRECRECEDWTEKDMLYVIGHVPKKEVSSLAMIYGDVYMADNEVYKRIFDEMKEGISNISGIEFSNTNELSRINKVDPLGITYLRVRGMWHISNPFDVFDYIYTKNKDKAFNLLVIMKKAKWASLEHTDELERLVKGTINLKIKDDFVKDPNNPAKHMDVKVITYAI